MGRLNGIAEQTHPAVWAAAASSQICSISSDCATRKNHRMRKMNTSARNDQNMPLNQRHGRRDSFHSRCIPSAASRMGSGSPMNSTSSAYAGAKFGDAPSPSLLPLPPRHWLSTDGPNSLSAGLQSPVLGPCQSLTSELKTLLQVA